MHEWRFEWDEIKDRANIAKHGIGFDEASRVFLDPLHVTAMERIVGGEVRWQTFGLVAGVRLLMVAHTIKGRNGLEIVRLISARAATKYERRKYEEQND